jgi:hypothetical protein
MRKNSNRRIEIAHVRFLRLLMGVTLEDRLHAEETRNKLEIITTKDDKNYLLNFRQNA